MSKAAKINIPPLIGDTLRSTAEHCRCDLLAYRVTDSTNLRARLYAEGGPHEADEAFIFTGRSPRKPDTPPATVQDGSPLEARGAFFIANEQTKGRGRLGRSFLSDEGRGLYISYLCKPRLTPQEALRLTAAAAVCVCRAIEELTGLEPRIKWVNDVFLGGKKVAGILTEGSISPSGELSFAVIGIGINLYNKSFPEELSDIATSIEAECGKRISKEELASELMRLLVDDSLYTSDAVMAEYKRLSFIIGKQIQVHSTTGSYPAVAENIDSEGRLIALDSYGNEHKLSSGEVSIRLTRKK